MSTRFDGHSHPRGLQRVPGGQENLPTR